jgi:hypothetical protein
MRRLALLFAHYRKRKSEIQALCISLLIMEIRDLRGEKAGIVDLKEGENALLEHL